MVEFFLEKNTTKFENPLAHIKNTLRALGSPPLPGIYDLLTSRIVDESQVVWILIDEPLDKIHLF